MFIPSINEMIRPTKLFVPQSGKRMPNGWHSPDEARLGKDCGSLIDNCLNAKLLRWWLVNEKGANVANWDLACEALYDGNKPALVLSEAKAYVKEFTRGASGNDAKNEDNRSRIKAAIEEACEGLSALVPGVNISSDNWYQFSNRVAFAWKLASLRIPTALIYLGFLGDDGISADPLQDHDHWRETVLKHTSAIFPSSAWERRLDVNGTPLWFLIRSLPSTRQSRPSASRWRRILILALGWHLSLRGVDNDFANWWHAYFRCLSCELGLPADWYENARTPRMICALAPDTRAGGFFSRFLEYTPRPGEMIIMRQHSPIKTAEANLREQLLDYGEALLVEFWPDIQGRVADEDRLVACLAAVGLPAQQPDPLDYM
jgi:hypothetical protein